MANPENKKRAWIMRCTSYHPGAPKFKYLRYLVIEANETKNIDFLYPMIKERNTNHPIVAIKCLIIILRILQQGPREILEQSYQYIDIPRDIGEKWNHNIYEHNKNPYHVEYCRLIHQFSLLIVNKLEFVHNYPMFDSKYSTESNENNIGVEDTIDMLSRLFTISSIIESCQTISFIDHPPFQATLSPLIDETQYLYGCLTKLMTEYINNSESDEMTTSLVENYNTIFDNTKKFFLKAKDYPIATIKDIPELPEESPLKDFDNKKKVNDALESINRATNKIPEIVDEGQLEGNDDTEDDVILGDLYRQGPEGIVPLFPPKDVNLNGMTITEYIAKLIKQKDNNICMECKSKPIKYASLNLGLFLCGTCGKLHKSLGQHISFVRLITSQTIKKRWLEPLVRIGNKTARNFWENQLDEKDRPQPGNRKELKSFIKKKYLKREFIAENSETPYYYYLLFSAEDFSKINTGSSTPLSEHVSDEIDIFDTFAQNDNNSSAPNILPSNMSQPTPTATPPNIINMQQFPQNRNGLVQPSFNMMYNIDPMSFQYPNYIHPVSIPYNYPTNMNPAYMNYYEMNPMRFQQNTMLNNMQQMNPQQILQKQQQQQQFNQNPQISNQNPQINNQTPPIIKQNPIIPVRPLQTEKRSMTPGRVEQLEQKKSPQKLLAPIEVLTPPNTTEMYENPFLSNTDGVVEDDETSKFSSAEDDNGEEEEDDTDEEDDSWKELTPKAAVVQLDITDEEEKARVALQKVLEDFKVSNIAIPYNEIQMGKRIGIGGFATVYKGVYNNEVVAVKRIQLTKMNDKAIKDFHSEVNLMHRLSHPNIVTFRGLVFDPVCLVTEFCENGNLFDLLHLKNADKDNEYIVQLPWQLRLKLV